MNVQRKLPLCLSLILYICFTPPSLDRLGSSVSPDHRMENKIPCKFLNLKGLVQTHEERWLSLRPNAIFQEYTLIGPL